VMYEDVSLVFISAELYVFNIPRSVILSAVQAQTLFRRQISWINSKYDVKCICSYVKYRLCLLS